MSNPETAKAAWQESATEATPPALDVIRAGADHFYRHVRRRNRIEYAATVLVVICFTAYTFLLPSPTARIGAGLVVLAALFVAWRLHRTASAAPPPEAESALPLLAHQRAQLVRQRDALASVGLWYLLPFAPGMSLMMFAPAFDKGPAVLLEMDWRAMVSIGVMIAVTTGIWWLNLRVARKLQKAIDDLDALAFDDAPKHEAVARRD